MAYSCEVLEFVKREMPIVNAVNICTDGPSSQFKNKFIFSMLPQLSSVYGIQICWNYFATSHGKGPNDALVKS